MCSILFGSGTNWLFDVLMILLRWKAERVNLNKLVTMLELHGAENVDNVPSPRVINCHLPPRFSDEYGPYPAYLNEWQEVIEARPGYPIHVMYFEDLKMRRYHGTYYTSCTESTGKWDYAHLNRGEEVKEAELLQVVMYFYALKMVNMDLTPPTWVEVMEVGPKFPTTCYVLRGYQTGNWKIDQYWSYHIYTKEWQVVIEDSGLKASHNGMKEIERLISFLEIDISDSLQRDILDMCGFQKMAADKMLIQDQDGERGNSTPFRKKCRFCRINLTLGLVACRNVQGTRKPAMSKSRVPDPNEHALIPSVGNQLTLTITLTLLFEYPIAPFPAKY
ncbi:hypothetical protein MAR_009133 [Mya arenaria]|uniref:Sulfotransferase n=1 Tax=Mya arenaria TaxID=6604 RepID=A0ABY7E0V8_MYAAR|nr:hypothetical protein MAR_009133 [Mya arenaria]